MRHKVPTVACLRGRRQPSPRRVVCDDCPLAPAFNWNATENTKGFRVFWSLRHASGDFIRRLPAMVVLLLVGFLVMVPRMTVGGDGQAVAVADLPAEIERLTEVAAAHRDAGELEDVERARRRRWELAEQLLAADEEENRWAKAVQVLSLVDGYSRDGEPVPGLVDTLHYKAAYELLAKSWQEMQAETGPLPAEIPARMFEVVQQARGMMSGVFKEENSKGIVHRSELIEILKAAESRDPCGIILLPMLAYLQVPPRDEAFLRAEVRPSLRQRQEMLAGIAHPAILRPVSGEEVERTDPGVALGGGKFWLGGKTVQKSSGYITEAGDVPAHAWHAPVEFCKQQSITAILADLSYDQYLRPDLPAEDAGIDRPQNSGGKYILPGVIVKVIDGFGNSAELIYGCLLLYRTRDSEGRNRTAVSYVNPDGEWNRRYIDVLMTRFEGDSKDLTTVASELQPVPPAASVTLGDSIIDLKELPAGMTERFLQQGTEVFCVDDAFKLLRTKFSNTKNQVDFLSKRQQSNALQVEAQVGTTSGVQEFIREFEDGGDTTKHPLRELLTQPGFSPLIVVSENDGESAEPNWIVRDGSSDRFLKTEDGSRLVFVNEGPDAIRFEMKLSDEITCRFPLNLASVPPELFERTLSYDVLQKLLLEAGYQKQSVRREILEFLLDPTHFPKRALQRLLARARATGKSTLEEAVKETLAEYGWTSDMNPRDDLLQLKMKFGIRHLRARGGSFVCSSELYSEGDPSGGDSDGSFRGRPPYAIFSSTGTELPDRQLYRFVDYEQLWLNRYREHAAKMLAIHPCLGSVRHVREQLLSPVVHPKFQPGPYDVGGASVEGSSASSDYAVFIDELLQNEYMTLSNVVPDYGIVDDELRRNIGALHLKRCADIRTIIQETVLIRYLSGRIAQTQWLLRQNRVHSHNTSGRSGECVPCSLLSLLAALESSRREAVVKLRDAQGIVVAEAWSSGRRFAGEGRMHRAIVCYNDVLSILEPVESIDTSIFAKVPTTDEAQKLVDELREFAEERVDIAAVEAELAGTLAAAGKAESAVFLWSSIAAEYRLLVAPLVDQVEDYMKAYGLRLTREIRQAIGEFDELVELCEFCMSDVAAAERWMRDAGLAGADDERAETLLREFESLLREGGRADRGKSIIGEMQQLQVSFETWLRLKQAVLGSPYRWFLVGNSYGGRSITEFAPVDYQAEEGFVPQIIPLVESCRIERLLEWAAGGGAEVAAVDASRFCFLLGWYWKDQGSLLYSRFALQQAAEHSAKAAAELDGVKAFTEQRNELVFLAGSFAAINLPFGVSVVRSGAVEPVRPRALLLEREWVAAGQDSGHIGREVTKVLELLEGVRKQDMRSDERSGRWFFMDYGFEFGAVPDEWVAAIIEKRDLVKDAVSEVDDGNGGKKVVPDEEKRASWQIASADIKLQVDSTEAEEANARQQVEQNVKEVVGRANTFVQEVYSEFVFGKYDRETVTMAIGRGAE